MANSSKSSKTSKAPKKANRKGSARAAAKAATAKVGSKSDFVRSNPTLSAPEIVALAAKQGMTLTSSHVYNIRATDKKKRGGAEASTASSRGSNSTGALSASDVESQFRSLLLRLGTDRVDQLLGEFRASPLFALVPTQGQAKSTRRRQATIEQATPRPASVPPPAPAQEVQHAT